jgi:hypothetical protein
VLSSAKMSPNVIITKAIVAVERRAAQLGFRKLFFICPLPKMSILMVFISPPLYPVSGFLPSPFSFPLSQISRGKNRDRTSKYNTFTCLYTSN